jgi:hypothetical protein
MFPWRGVGPSKHRDDRRSPEDTSRSWIQGAAVSLEAAEHALPRYVVASELSKLRCGAAQPASVEWRERYGKIADETAFFAQMIEAERLVIRRRVRRLYGVLLDKPPGT